MLKEGKKGTYYYTKKYVTSMVHPYQERNGQEDTELGGKEIIFNIMESLGLEG